MNFFCAILKHGVSALKIASVMGNTAVLQALLQANPNVNILDKVIQVLFRFCCIFQFIIFRTDVLEYVGWLDSSHFGSF